MGWCIFSPVVKVGLALSWWAWCEVGSSGLGNPHPVVEPRIMIGFDAAIIYVIMVSLIE